RHQQAMPPPRKLGINTARQRDRAAMPPPPVPRFRAANRPPSKPTSHPAAERRLMPPPSMPSRGRKNLPASPAPVGFTTRELEDFVDDDLQLTQIAPG
ncbi:hypothetical protein LTR53_016635, partial [Teratosphaeriaceae sp. CCFEE 6253]